MLDGGSSRIPRTGRGGCTRSCRGSPPAVRSPGSNRVPEHSPLPGHATPGRALISRHPHRPHHRAAVNSLVAGKGAPDAPAARARPRGGNPGAGVRSATVGPLHAPPLGGPIPPPIGFGAAGRTPVALPQPRCPRCCSRVQPDLNAPGYLSTTRVRENGGPGPASHRSHPSTLAPAIGPACYPGRMGIARGATARRGGTVPPPGYHRMIGNRRRYPGRRNRVAQVLRASPEGVGEAADDISRLGGRRAMTR